MEYNIEGLELVKKFLDEKPGVSPLFSAINASFKGEFNNIEDVSNFYKEYIEFLRRNDDSEEGGENAERTAKENMRHLIGDYPHKIFILWMEGAGYIKRPEKKPKN